MPIKALAMYQFVISNLILQNMFFGVNILVDIFMQNALMSF